MMQSVRDSLNKANTVIAENQESLHSAIKNLEVFTASLARNSDKIDQLMSDTTGAMAAFHKLGNNLDTRFADVASGVNKMTDTATKQIEIVGGDAHRAIIHIDKAVTDLMKNPQRILFGGGANN